MARQELRVERLKEEPYPAFIERSELIARAAIQRAFDRDLLTSTLVIYIIGLHQGAEAPVMSVEVTRSQWQQRPTPRRWATYYRMAQTLLGFGNSSIPVLEGPSVPPGAILQQPLSAPLPAPIASPTPTSQPLLPRSRRSRKALPTPSPTATPVVSPVEPSNTR